MFPSQGANQRTRNYFFCASSVSEEKTDTYFDRMQSEVFLGRLGLTEPEHGNFPLHAPSSAEAWSLQGDFPSVAPSLSFTASRILAAVKSPTTSCPHNSQSLPGSLETSKHCEQPFHTLVWPIWRNDQEKKCSLSCLIITLPFINQRESAGRQHDLIFWWLSFFILLQRPLEQCKRKQHYWEGPFTVLFWKIRSQNALSGALTYSLTGGYKASSV